MTAVSPGLVLLDTDVWSVLFADAKQRDRIAATALAIGAPLLSGDGIYQGTPELVLLGA